jgi:hypothetical protein
MKASFKCGVCGEKLTLTGAPDGIERARVMWLKGHEHPVADLRNSMSLIRDVCKSYDPLAAAITSRVIANAALAKAEPPEAA